MKYILNFTYTLVIYIYLIKPRLKRHLMLSFIGQKFAHRGLHCEKIPENSLVSFGKAVDEGVGIELDIQLTADREVIVFHDDNLSRANGVDKRIRELTLDEIRKAEIFGSSAGIPTFAEVLALVDGKVPLLIDLKPSGLKNGFTLCKKVAALLDNYKGEFCVESFNPFYLLWFRLKRPRITRGLLMCRFPYNNYKRYFPIILLMRSMILNALARPDFIAYDFNHRYLWSLKLCRLVFRVPVFAWTVPQSLIGSGQLAKYHSFIYENPY